MSAAGFDAVNLANNHILDQGVEGLVDTLTYLNDYGIAHAGAGMNGTEAYEPAYFERKGMKIALLGFSRVVPVASWKADGNRAGVAEAYDSTRAIAAIQSARKKADLVIVVAHWGRACKYTECRSNEACARIRGCGSRSDYWRSSSCFTGA